MVRGYHSYRGRRNPLRVLLAVLLILVILGSLALLLIQKLVVFEENGAWHLKQTEAQEEKTSEQTASAVTDEELVIEPPEEPTPTERTPQLQQTTLAALQGGAVTQAEGCNGWAFPVKDSSGMLAYDTAVEAAASSGAGGSVSREGLAQLLEEDAYYLAQFACCHDSVYSMANMTGAGLCQPSGYVWFDYQNSHWLDVSKPEARAYLASLVQELADLGFDEILLQEFQYPVRGKLHKIDYTALTMSREEALCRTAQELQSAIEGTGCRLSMQVTAELLETGSQSEAGWNLSELAGQFDRFYVETSAEQFPLLEEKLHAVNPEAELVPVGYSRADGAFLMP